jgi:hypothetical protein
MAKPRTIKTPGEAPQAEEQPPVVKAVEPSPSGLPRLEDIDPTKISRSVLTTGGWVCPA